MMKNQLQLGGKLFPSDSSNSSAGNGSLSDTIDQRLQLEVETNLIRLHQRELLPYAELLLVLWSRSDNDVNVHLFGCDDPAEARNCEAYSLLRRQWDAISLFRLGLRYWLEEPKPIRLDGLRSEVNLSTTICYDIRSKELLVHLKLVNGKEQIEAESIIEVSDERLVLIQLRVAFLRALLDANGQLNQIGQMVKRIREFRKAPRRE